MGQGDVMDALKKHPEGLFIAELIVILGTGRSSVNRCTVRLAEQGFVIVERVKVPGYHMKKNRYKLARKVNGNK